MHLVCLQARPGVQHPPGRQLLASETSSYQHCPSSDWRGMQQVTASTCRHVKWHTSAFTLYENWWYSLWSAYMPTTYTDTLPVTSYKMLKQFVPNLGMYFCIPWTVLVSKHFLYIWWCHGISTRNSCLRPMDKLICRVWLRTLPSVRSYQVYIPTCLFYLNLVLKDSLPSHHNHNNVSS